MGSLIKRALDASSEIKVPPAKAWWCPLRFNHPFVALKLKYRRLKPVVLITLQSTQNFLDMHSSMN